MNTNIKTKGAASAQSTPQSGYVSATPAYDINFDVEELKQYGIDVYLKMNTLTISYPTSYDGNLSNFLDNIPTNLDKQEQADMIDKVAEIYMGIMITRVFKIVGKISK
jgi:hypothetical protein